MITLRPFGPGDFAFILSCIESEADMVQWSGLGFQWPLTERQLADYHAATQQQNPAVRAWSVFDAKSGAMAGHVALANMNYRHGMATISRVLIAPSHRGQGLCRPLIREVVRLGFEDLGLRRINLAVYDFNAPAIRCYEACGFVHEGRWREFAQVGDQTWNLLWMALLRRDWEQGRQEGL